MNGPGGSLGSPAMATDRELLINNSKVFCMLPWVSLNVHPTGKVFPCCYAHSDMPIGNLRDSALAEVWNSPELRRIRLNMLNGLESPQCGKCYALEKINAVSLRQEQNREFAHHFQVVETTRGDGSVDRVNLPYLDIRFSNLCNFKCRYCSPQQSTAWHADYALLWGPSQEPRYLTPTQPPEDLWRQIEALLPNVELIYFTGGEPLITPEHFRILSRLAENKAFHVRLTYNTNFSETAFQGNEVMELWNKFEHVCVAASLDAMGARGEYLRHGQDWNRVMENRKRMLAICPKVTFTIAPTLTAMNALHLADFHWDWVRRGYIGVNDIVIGMLFEPEYYRVQVLPLPLKEKVAEKYQEHISRMKQEYGDRAGRAEQFYRAAMDFMMERDMSSLLPKFREVTKKLDGIRRENFREVFPELAELMA